jgi:hypothetical protein
VTIVKEKMSARWNYDFTFGEVEYLAKRKIGYDYAHAQTYYDQRLYILGEVSFLQQIFYCPQEQKQKWQEEVEPEQYNTFMSDISQYMEKLLALLKNDPNINR